eukprot:m51a1_g7075 hypothetical protein (857) ;mRNA; f:215216-218409
MRLALCLFALFLFPLRWRGLALVARAQQAELHVSPTGLDSAEGSWSHPLATPEGALAKLPSVPAGGVRVVLHAGVYAINKTLALTATRPAGLSVDSPLVFEAYGNDTVVLSGGATLSAGLFRALDKTRDAAAWGRIPAAARPSVLVTSVQDHGIALSQWGPLVRRGTGGQRVGPSELWFGSERMRIARWPNANHSDPEDIFDLIKGNELTLRGTAATAGLYLRNGTNDGEPMWKRASLVNGLQYYLYRLSWVYNHRNYTAWFVSPSKGVYPSGSVPFWHLYSKYILYPFSASTDSGATGTVYIEYSDRAWKGFIKINSVRNESGRVFGYPGTRPSSWAQQDVWATGLWFWHWSDMSCSVQINKTDKTVTLSAPSTYGIKVGQPFYFWNVLEELDEAGEYYFDKDTGKLYFWPPAPIGTKEVAVSLMSSPLVSLKSVSGVEFRGITFEYTRGLILSISGSNNVLDSCIIRNTGGSAVSMSGTSNGITNCTVRNCGSGCITMSGGVRASLTNGNNYVQFSEISDFSYWDRTYSPAVSVSGCGNSIRHNSIHGSPHTGILFAGNEHRLFYNEIYDVCQHSSDSGAIYGGRNWGLRGNRFYHNFIHDIVGFDEDSYVQGIYTDDAASGISTKFNVFYNIHGHATMSSGGRDNIIRNNLFIRCSSATQTDRRGTTVNNVPGSDWNLLEKLHADGIHYQQDPWASRYPSLAAVPDSYAAIMAGNWSEPQGCVFSCNAGWRVGEWLSEGTWGGAGGFAFYKEIRDNLEDADPLVADEAAMDFRLLPASPVLRMGCWHDVRFEKMGRKFYDDSSDELYDEDLVDDGSSSGSASRAAGGSTRGAAAALAPAAAALAVACAALVSH